MITVRDETKVDPYAFTNMNERGDIVPHDDPNTVALDVWYRVIDLNTRKPTGMVKRDHMRTLLEVFKDLNARMDVQICNKCKAERKRPVRYTEDPHKDCGGEWESLIDEYFSGPDNYAGYPTLVPARYSSIACYPVTGGSEGHYVHIEFISWDPSRGHEKVNEATITRLALGKTFRGMDHAAEIARRCAVLLGA